MGRKSVKITVVGAGAIGGVTAGFLAREGYDVEIVSKYEDLADKIRHKGIHVFGVGGDFSVVMPAFAKVTELSGTRDIVLLATKATDMIEAARELLPYLKESTAVVSMQNGICEEALAGVVGRERIVGCVVGWGGTMHGPGEIEMTSKGEFVIGNIDNKDDPRLELIQEILSTIVPVHTTNNMLGNLYSKLIINSCITSLGAVCGLYLGEMLAERKIRNIFIQIMIEAMDVANAMGLNVEIYGGKLNYYTFTEGTGALKRFKRHLVIRLIGFKYRRLKSSMLQSLERGKKTEIDYMNGYICEQGKRFEVPTPVNDTIVRMIREIENGDRKISRENFNDPFFKVFE
ncbi:MAG TPA: ketopantoate reductase family protein [Spirochaetota bacterium]|nr:ketopantoate reductase family protein [Spirochaetota bacterium]HQO02573.1 ketopantoate reductase family protein [Spirochaetota bacterium]HQP47197.1 ketopantoate reductase family protein [Spirochaetota bacterium]